MKLWRKAGSLRRKGGSLRRKEESSRRKGGSLRREKGYPAKLPSGALPKGGSEGLNWRPARPDISQRVPKQNPAQHPRAPGLGPDWSTRVCPRVPPRRHQIGGAAPFRGRRGRFRTLRAKGAKAKTLERGCGSLLTAPPGNFSVGKGEEESKERRERGRATRVSGGRFCCRMGEYFSKTPCHGVYR